MVGHNFKKLLQDAARPVDESKGKLAGGNNFLHALHSRHSGICCPAWNRGWFSGPDSSSGSPVWIGLLRDLRPQQPGNPEKLAAGSYRCGLTLGTSVSTMVGIIAYAFGQAII
jgi:hypothetical protein